jgi:hypothetical protein
MSGIVVGEVSAEASRRSIQVARSRGQVDKGEAIAVGRHVLPGGTE